jgi:hypothetical protein
LDVLLLELRLVLPVVLRVVLLERDGLVCGFAGVLGLTLDGFGVDFGIVSAVALGFRVVLRPERNVFRGIT